MRNGVGKPRSCSRWWSVRLVGREGQSYHVTVFCVLDIGSLSSVRLWSHRYNLEGSWCDARVSPLGEETLS